MADPPSERKAIHLQVLGIDGGLAASKKPTGVEYFARSLCYAMLAEIPEDFEVRLYLPQGHLLQLQDSPRLSLHLRPEMNLRLRDPWLIVRSWKDRLSLFLSFGHRIPLGVRGLLVPTIYDTIYEDFPECYPPGVPQQQRTQVRSAVNRAWAVLTDSQATAASIRKHYSPDASTMVALGAPRELFRPGTPERKRPYILFVGRIDARKNVPLLVQAYRSCLRKHSLPHSLVIVGPDDSGSDALRRELEVGSVAGEDIQRPGYLDEEQLLRLYQGAAAFVYPSRAEGFGLPVLEAMACGVPVITSNCSALAEVAGDGAIQVDPNQVQEIAQALESILVREEGTRWIDRGLARVKHFCWKKSARTIWNALRLAPR